MKRREPRQPDSHVDGTVRAWLLARAVCVGEEKVQRRMRTKGTRLCGHRVPRAAARLCVNFGVEGTVCARLRLYLWSAYRCT
jgi:hypothetical protein